MQKTRLGRTVLTGGLALASALSSACADDGVMDDAADFEVLAIDKVVGGSKATPNGFPAQVALFRSNGSFMCGGSVIHQRWVLTAKHCADPAFVTVGSSVLGAGARINVVETFGHPSVDIQLLRLDADAGVTPVEFDDGSGLLARAGAATTIVGWGKTSDGDEGMISKDLLKVDNLPVISNADCNGKDWYGGRGWKVGDHEVCVGKVGTSRSVCRGDSGGPLLEARQGRTFAIGVASWIPNCGGDHDASVYARVGPAADWIYSTIGPYAFFDYHTGTALHETGANFEFETADNGDVFAIAKNGTGSGSTEVHVLSADSVWQSFSLQTGTPLHETGDSFEFLLAANRDLYAISKSGTGSGSTEVHVLSAASNYQEFSLHTGTALHETGATFKFLIADNNDIFAISKSETGSGMTEVHVLSADSGYQEFSQHAATALHPTGDTFDFVLDRNRDVLAISKANTGTHSTEIHALRADTGYTEFGYHRGTPLHETGASFEFGLGRNDELIAISKSGTGTGSTELHILRP